MASAPKHKHSFVLDYKLNKFSVNLRFTGFAAITLIDYSYDPSGEFNGPRTTTDLSFSYQFTPKLSATLGGANIFDVYPTVHKDPGLTETGTRFEAIQMGMGGAYFFAKLGIKF